MLHVYRLLVLALIVAATGCVSAATITLTPGDQIQSAIEGADSGDVIVLGAVVCAGRLSLAAVLESLAGAQAES